MEIDLGEENKHALCFRTGDINALTKMFQAVKDIEKIIRLGYNSDGLYMNEVGSDSNIAIFGTFPAVNFHEYKADGPGILCFHTGSFISALINNSQRDEVTVSFNPNLKKKKNELIITIKRESSSDTDIQYSIPLLEGERSMYEWKNSAIIKYVVMVKSDIIQSFISTIIQTGSDTSDTIVKISINENIVCFECIDGVFVSNIRLAIMTDKGKQQRVSIRKKSITDGTVSKKFYVRFMNQIIKFMNINTNDSVTLYMADDDSYPIIFQINVGSLGCVRIAMGPVTNN